MATVIQVNRPDLGAQVGQQFSSGFSSSFDKQIELQTKQREQQKKQQLLNSLARDISQAKTKDEALSLAGDPRYQGLFNGIEDMQNFGKLVEQQFGKPESVKAFSAVVDGQPRNVLLTESQQRDIATGKKELKDILGLPPESDAMLGELNDAGLITLVDQKTGKVTRQIPPDQLNTRATNEITQQGFENMLKLRDAKRKEQKAKQGKEAKSPKEFEAQAMGMLQARGLDKTQENINLAVNVAKAQNAFGRKAQVSFQIDPKTGLEAIKGSGKGERFQIYSTVFPDLMFSGLPGNKAHNIALRIAKSVPVKAQTIEGKTVVKPPERQVKAVTDPKKAAALLKSGPVGMIIKNGQKGTLIIKIGKEQFLEFDSETGSFVNG